MAIPLSVPAGQALYHGRLRYLYHGRLRYLYHGRLRYLYQGILRYLYQHGDSLKQVDPKVLLSAEIQPI